MELILFLAAFALLGVGAAATQYPWRRPVAQPYLIIVAVLFAPLALIVILQAAFGLPAGACVERPLNNAPLVLGLVPLIAGIALAIRFREARRFTIALTVGVLPLTLMWAIIAVMSLAGCWI